MALRKLVAHFGKQQQQHQGYPSQGPGGYPMRGPGFSPQPVPSFAHTLAESDSECPDGIEWMEHGWGRAGMEEFVAGLVSCIKRLLVSRAMMIEDCGT